MVKDKFCKRLIAGNLAVVFRVSKKVIDVVFAKTVINIKRTA